MLSVVSFNKFTDDIRGLSNNIETIVNTLRSIKHYLFNPTELIGIAWNLSVKYSKPICLIVCFGGFIIYLIGIKKGAKISTGSILAYVVIKIFNAAL